LNSNPVYQHINKILIGSLLWGAFYLYVFFDESAWNLTFFGELFQGYSYELMYMIQIIFFGMLVINLYHFTVGKKYSQFNFSVFFKVLIASSMLVAVTQFFLQYFELNFHYGLIGYLTGSRFNQTFVDTSLLIYILYLMGTILISIYISLFIVYLFQIKKMGLDVDSTVMFRALVALAALGWVLGSSPSGFDWIRLAFFILYILFACIVYLRTKYSLKAMMISIVILFIL
jgi:hypothetical protein